MPRILLLSNSGRPYLEYARDEIRDFLGPIRRIGFVSAASLGDEDAYFERFREAAAGMGLAADHVRWDRDPRATLDRVEAVFVGGGNTYALLKRMREAGLIEPIRDRARAGLLYLGSSAGSNLAGPTILTTNDWNVVALTEFEALGLVPFNINPHYLEADPLKAPGSETRGERIAEYHVVNANPVFGIEEGAMIRVEEGVATVRGHARVKVFHRGFEPVWYGPGDRLP
jgi:dipeptidase E